MPAYKFICHECGEQERFKCVLGQQVIDCRVCGQEIQRSNEPHAAGFTVNGAGTYDNGKYKAKK